jgi:hypothetical protein
MKEEQKDFPITVAAHRNDSIDELWVHELNA